MSKTAGFFNEYLPSKLEKNPDLAKINAVFQFDITGAGTWTLDLKNGGGVSEGAGANPADCVLTTDQATWETILEKPSQAVASVMMGKLKVSNLGLATSLQKILA